MKGFRLERRRNGGGGKQARGGRKPRGTCLIGPHVPNLGDPKNREKPRVRRRKMGANQASCVPAKIGVQGCQRPYPLLSPHSCIGEPSRAVRHPCPPHRRPRRRTPRSSRRPGRLSLG